ncbi:NADH-quinone oxidoreductase subunit C [Marichromatium bheemlicum]|uniref:Ni,Fe-hydrogenase III large subunit n=1 Tax=Marichromatium bheemlicum TaxID=365339 RepID=A0ABX1I8G5_9GAMM|nr:NADH-quinone oxidoreductase subunit C [Marichromatium bheemlicum]NKN32680.1 Ni,Fe-hydrogenase III large subunit [Marichromatium bheemlicum]
MNVTDSLADLQGLLTAPGIGATACAGVAGVEPCLALPAAHWGLLAELAADAGLRHAGVWADALDADRLRVQALFAAPDGYLLAQTEVTSAHPELASHTPCFPGVDRLERHAQDLLGVRFVGHPRGTVRWTRHQAWPETVHPLRPGFPLAGKAPGRTPADADYPIVRLQGNGVFEVPVGPVHAGVIAPGHFRFQVMGEDVLRLEERLGYVHKGIEKHAVGRDAAGLVRLAARVAADSSVAHAWAAAQALERACGTEVPARALHLRALLAERERVANHLGDIGGICNDVGFSFGQSQCTLLRERWQRDNATYFGHRLLMDTLVPGGVAQDLAATAPERLIHAHAELRRVLRGLFDILDDHPPLNDRLLTTGILKHDTARLLGCTGYVGKGSGLAHDLRHHAPYAPYDRLQLAAPVVEQEGDVAARMRVRMREVHASLELLDQLLATLPEGAIATSLMPRPEGCGLGLVEGWRGELVALVRLDAEARVARYFPRDPSWFNWPALEHLILGNIVPDFPVCNKSVNGSYSGVDL